MPTLRRTSILSLVVALCVATAAAAPTATADDGTSPSAAPPPAARPGPTRPGGGGTARRGRDQCRRRRERTPRGLERHRRCVRLGRDAPPAPDGRFRIGSITKLFTSTLVLQLAGEHRVSLDRPVQHYLPRLLPDRYPAISVRQLLDHTSGLPVSHIDDAALDPAWFVRHRFEGWSPREIVDDATRGELEFAPGAAQSYNGTNYFVAGLLVERVTGRRYGHELRTRILEPLGMRDTSLPAHGNPLLRAPHAHGYLRVGRRLHDVTAQNPYAWAEGGMVSSTADLERFLSEVTRGSLLEPAQRRELHRLPRVPYVGGAGHCRLAPEPSRACLSVMFEATRLPRRPHDLGQERVGARQCQRRLRDPAPRPGTGLLAHADGVRGRRRSARTTRGRHLRPQPRPTVLSPGPQRRPPSPGEEDTMDTAGWTISVIAILVVAVLAWKVWGGPGDG